MSAEMRDYFFQPNKDPFEHMAYKAIKAGLASHEFILVAIDVDDPTWSDLVDKIMSGVDWRAKRDRGELKIVRSALFVENTVDYLCHVCPDITPAFINKIPDGFVRTVVLADGGASVYCVEPFPHYRNG